MILAVLVWVYDFLSKNQSWIVRLLVPGTALLALFKYMNTVWSDLFTKVDALAKVAMPSTLDFSPLGLINYCFPMDTLLTAISAYATLRLACAGIRVIKSFIPTVA